MDQKIKDEPTRLNINFDNFEALFSEETHIEATKDHVIIMFVQKIPGAPKEHPNGKVVSRIVMSWPEFARTSKLFTRILQTHKGKAQDSFIKNVMQETFEPYE